MRKQLCQLLAQLVIKHGICINEAELKLQLLSHPSYPSLHALTGVVDHFGISHLTLRLPANEETLTQLLTRFIANILQE